ncbi:MAG: hypothetical protein FD167_950, partial [bacterium]
MARVAKPKQKYANNKAEFDGDGGDDGGDDDGGDGSDGGGDGDG